MWKHKKQYHGFGWVPLTDWYGFFVSALVIAGITTYAFFISFGTYDIPMKSAPQESLALVALAVSNNVGTGASRSQEIPILSPNDVSTAQNAVVRDAMDWEIFFVDIFRQLSEYEEVAKIDIPSYLSAKTDKQEALENYIDELARHTEKARITLQAVSSQITFHQNAFKNVQNDIKKAQAEIESAYINRNSSGIINAIADLDEFVLVQQDHKYGQIFGQQIIKEYQSVIQFSENKLQVMQANIPALVQWVTVNLPKWTQVGDLEQLQIFSRETQ